MIKFKRFLKDKNYLEFTFQIKVFFIFIFIYILNALLIGVFKLKIDQFIQSAIFNISFSLFLIFALLYQKNNFLFLMQIRIKLKILGLIFLIIILYLFLNKFIYNFNFSFESFNIKNLIFSFIFFFICALPEELYRQLSLKNYNNNTNCTTLIISSFFFSLLHLSNPSFTIISFINLFLSGIILCLILLKYKLIYTTFIHAFWNYFNWILGLPVSGIMFDYFKPIIKINYKNNIITEKFGIEGSVYFLLILIFILILIYKKKLNEIYTKIKLKL